MKISKSRLNKIIKEELNSVLQEKGFMQKAGEFIRDTAGRAYQDAVYHGDQEEDYGAWHEARSTLDRLLFEPGEPNSNLVQWASNMVVKPSSWKGTKANPISQALYDLEWAMDDIAEKTPSFEKMGSKHFSTEQLHQVTKAMEYLESGASKEAGALVSAGGTKPEAINALAQKIAKALIMMTDSGDENVFAPDIKHLDRRPEKLVGSIAKGLEDAANLAGQAERAYMSERRRKRLRRARK